MTLANFHYNIYIRLSKTTEIFLRNKNVFFFNTYIFNIHYIYIYIYYLIYIYIYIYIYIKQKKQNQTNFVFFNVFTVFQVYIYIFYLLYQIPTEIHDANIVTDSNYVFSYVTKCNRCKNL